MFFYLLVFLLLLIRSHRGGVTRIGEYAECQTRPVCGVCERVNELSWATAAAAAARARARSRAVSSSQIGRAAELGQQNRR